MLLPDAVFVDATQALVVHGTVRWSRAVLERSIKKQTHHPTDDVVDSSEHLKTAAGDLSDCGRRRVRQESLAQKLEPARLHEGEGTVSQGVSSAGWEVGCEVVKLCSQHASLLCAVNVQARWVGS